MPGKSAAKTTIKTGSVSQPSILSFFGKGSSSNNSSSSGAASAPPATAAAAAKRAPRARTKNKQPRKLVDDGEEARGSGAGSTSTPAPKRRKKARAGADPVDRTAATTSDPEASPVTPAGTGARASKSLVSPAAPAAAAAVPDRRRGSSPRTTTRGDDQRERGGRAVAPAAAAASGPRGGSKVGKSRGLGLAAGGGGGGGEGSEAPSPQTDGENSPLAPLSRRAQKAGTAAAVGESAKTPLKQRSRGNAGGSARGGGGKGSSEANGADSGSGAAAEAGGAEEGEKGPLGGSGRSERRPGEERRDSAAPNIAAAAAAGGRGSEAGGETDGDGEGSDEDGSDGAGRRGGKNGVAGGQQQGQEEEEGKKKVEKSAGVEDREAEGAEGTEGVDNGEEDEEEEEQEEEGQTETGGISQYELQRLERIKRNQAFMATLGLASAKPPAPMAGGSSAVGGGAKGRSKKRSRPVSRVKEKAPAVPVRRSARARGAEAVDYNEDTQAMSAIAAAARAAAARAPDPEPVLEEIDFDDSTVLKYLCGGEAEDGSGSSSGTGPASVAAVVPEGARVVGLRVVDPDRPLAASGLSTIYTMHFCGGGGGVAGGGGRKAPPLLAAGGKGGVVALFSTQRQVTPSTNRNGGGGDSDEEEEDERTLMNFKAHKGWVSAVRFLDGDGGGGGGGGRGGAAAGAGGGCRLLSSANDSVVKLWDTSKQHRGSPRLLCDVGDLHHTRKGIFAMDSYGTRVATGSKDTTVAVASLRPTGLERDRVLGDPGGSEAFHEKVVKGVSLRDENTVASCGDDSNVRVCDLRSPSPSRSGLSHCLDGAHDGPCHTVRWHPLDPNLLLSAGLDSTVKLHDLRRPGTPLHVFRGHCPYALARPRSIHRPEFFFSAARAGEGTGGGVGVGVNVITCGEKSEKLSMYDAGTGATVSRGVLGAEASALAVGGGAWSSPSNAARGASAVAAALPGGSVVLLEPVWGTG